MNRELQQVRRYWPKAKYVGLRRTERPHHEYSANGCKLCVYLDGRCFVEGGASKHGVWRPAIWPTIPEAMCAAGFGVRPLGEYASRLKSSRTVVYKRGTYVVIATVDWQPMCVDRQRPRKGARLGRRKREV